MKRIISLVLVTILGIVLFSGCGTNEIVAKDSKVSRQTKETSNSAAKPEVIRIGSIIGTISTIAKEQGFFEEEFNKDGIKVEYQSFTSGPPITEAFISNKLDIATYGDQPAIVAAANGAGVKAVGSFTGGYDKLALVAQIDSDIKSPKDLKGKKVGITVGTVVQHMLYLYLDSAGLKPEDVSIVNLQPNDLITALAAKNIDAAVTVEPFTTVILAKKAGKQISDSTGLKYMAGPIVASNDFITKYPEIINRLLKAYDKAKKWEEQNKDKASEILAKELNIPKEVVLAGIISKDTDNVKITEDVSKAFEQTYQFLRSSNFIKKDYDIKSFYDVQFLKAAGLQ
ncbi:putative aliphatic sulfonates-binding protein precursor [Ruminiclostridium hungatei]|uniref:Putative aliphatic sulfonates-binding protein n=1 Tax=Ruminiclostridium hungatei TaxID=48256 RepID=A0A1V4SHR5_RUMHU|nr:aliphatic sulfonate ABC transporter substrate-binding protein [Ruminiclostridium hungatei]OPX43344.1 putative aliphatic sulfonates-binding protein precursor [Ruminiclostridium hungatei]